jgi:protoheme ferro-lyase
LASDAEIAPPVFYASAKDNLILQTRIDKKAHHFKDMEQLEDLIDLVKKLHSLPLPTLAVDDHYSFWARDAAKMLLENNPYILSIEPRIILYTTPLYQDILTDI